MSEALHTDEMMRKYLRDDGLPSIWCPGCGIGTIVGAMLRAIDSLNLDPDKVIIATGIGCSGFIYNYLKFDCFHGTHGRALPAATGIKIANPELTVIAPLGDGDCAAIGGNHFVHAARRNIDLTTIVINNQIYGMTGGQYSPTTPRDSRASTAPRGHIERAFDICELAKGAGATYIARGTTFHNRQLIGLIANAITHKGFSVVEVMSQCPVQFGRRNEMKTAEMMLRWQKDHAVPARAAVKMTPEQLEGKFLTGELVRIEAPEWTEEYGKIIQEAKGSIDRAR